MQKTFDAVYENGVIRPLEPRVLTEYQHLTVSIPETSAERAAPWLDHEYMAAVDSTVELEPTWEEVREALSTIPGSLADDINAERNAGG